MDRLRPDLYILTDDQINDINDNSQFVILNDLFPKNSNLFKDMYGYLKNYFLDSNNYCIIPLTFSTIFLACNNKALNNCDSPLPKNFNIDKLRKYFKKLSLDTNGDGIQDQYALSILPYPTRWITIANLFDVDFNNLSGSRNELVAALDFLHNLLYRDHSAVLNAQLNEKVDPFYHDRAIFSISNAIEMAGCRYYNEAFEASASSLLNKGKKKQMLIMDGIVLSRESRNIEMALAFMKTLLSDNVQQHAAQTNGFPSIFKSINEKVWDKSQLRNISIADDIEDVFFVKDIFGGSNNFIECGHEMQLFWLGLETARNTADQIIEIIGRTEQK
jgi:multiple sugar transport system substrate-binding protein